MAQEVALYKTADLETTKVEIPTSGTLRGYSWEDRKIVQEQITWLERNGTGIFSWRGATKYGFMPPKAAVFFISDPDTALAFKMRWG